ncbi:MAG: rane protein [Bacillales bacterium]|jgi:uncharacterized membrane protein YdjX (TVP38/TMEM64 family)|nr:rane protein [Bacillales bacterium]
MEYQIVSWFENLGMLAIFVSIIINIIISILGVLPSVFITAANISFFGFNQGLVLSIIGEALGAIVSFYLYRKGFRKLEQKYNLNNKYTKRLLATKGFDAFILIIGLRLFPFIPSGLITFASAGSKVGILNFSIASTLGKIPALFIEAYSIQQVLVWSWQGKAILFSVSVFIIAFIIFKRFKNSDI